MHDDPALTVPMVEWSTVDVVKGIAEVLEYLHASGRRIILATSAAISDESQIRGALGRGCLAGYFSRIYCFKNTHLPKGEASYGHILSDLDIVASEALMVGDSLEKDVQDANAAGIFAVWFNLRSDEIRKNKLHITVHSMEEALEYFKLLDQKN